MPEWGSSRHRTAISRAALSMPARQALLDGLLARDKQVLDYGAGRGLDVQRLQSIGFEARGWDPHFAPDSEVFEADTVLLLYVLNVIEDPAERSTVLAHAWGLTRSSLVISARLKWDSRRVSGDDLSDGVLSARGTFQHLYSTEELRELVETVTGSKCFVATPGVVYAFRDESARMALIARRTMPADSWTPTSSGAKAVGQVVEFIETRGRPPLFDELPPDYLDQLAKIPWQRLMRLAKAAARPQRVEEGRRRSTLDTLLFLGIELFNGRGRLSSMPLMVQENIRRFFASYREACARADRLLLKIRDDSYVRGAMRNSVGKLTPTALYVHRRAVDHMPVVLRLYEHCGAVAAGRPVDYEILKLAHEGRQVSWLGYPEFDTDPHPRTAWSYSVNMANLQTRHTSYESRLNRPLLHRKEEFLHPDDPHAAKYRRLTQSEIKAGLYRNPQLIGTEAGWQQELDRLSLTLRGHRVIRAKVSDHG